jgi:hypothetical protein
VSTVSCQLGKALHSSAILLWEHDWLITGLMADG